jgi:ribosome-associated protein
VICREAALAQTQSSRAENPGEQRARSLQIATAAAQIAQDNRGQDIALLDLRDLTAVFDYFLLVTGTSSRQLHAIAEEIDHALTRQLGQRRFGREGLDTGNWILLDYGDVVVHLFDSQAREYYALEQLWSDARRVEWPVAPSPRILKAD